MEMPKISPKKRSHSNEILEFRGICKVYGNATRGFPALKDVSFDISEGEFVIITGKSGSGKSTLLNLMAGLDQPTSGELFYKGTRLGDLGEQELTSWRGRNVGVVFQFFQLLPTLTTIENIVIAMDFVRVIPKNQRRERAMELLRLVGISDQADKLPNKLSGGQQQRAAIARALANDPPIIIADEPTGNLDTENANLMYSLLKQLNDSGKTIVMVTHDTSLEIKGTRTITLSNGELSWKDL